MLGSAGLGFTPHVITVKAGEVCDMICFSHFHFYDLFNMAGTGPSYDYAVSMHACCLEIECETFTPTVFTVFFFLVM